MYDNTKSPSVTTKVGAHDSYITIISQRQLVPCGWGYCHHMNRPLRNISPNEDDTINFVLLFNDHHLMRPGDLNQAKKGPSRIPTWSALLVVDTLAPSDTWIWLILTYCFFPTPLARGFCTSDASGVTYIIAFLLSWSKIKPSRHIYAYK